jgi:GT2 family glycosyltransferase
MKIPIHLPMVPVSTRPTVLHCDALQIAGALDFAPQGTVVAPGSEFKFSIIVVTYNSLAFTRLCLASVLDDASVAAEVIVVDNASTDGTVEFLQHLARVDRRVRIILNSHNAGFAAANNQGLAIASAPILVLLNNDTIVSPGWLLRMESHLADRTVGMVGPVSNRVCNEAQIDVSYQTYGQFLQAARERYEEHRGEHFDIRMLAMYCVAFRRQVFEKVGPLDEGYGVGLFEDDDYAMRVKSKDLRVVCADDTLIHHFGEGSFGTLIPTGEHGVLFRRNQAKFEEKWKVRWTPHRHRPRPAYMEMVRRVHKVLANQIKDTAPVAVVSRGCQDLVNLPDRPVWHFPRTSDGTYSGHYPSDCDQAVSLVQEAYSAGARYLLFPETSLWWLDHYPGLRETLELHCTRLHDEHDPCVIYDLQDWPAQEDYFLPQTPVLA